MSINKKILIFLISVVSFIGTAINPLMAAPSAGYGYTPKYPENFKHFDYVNPNAPRGGTLTLASLAQTFDSFNPFVLKGVAADGIDDLVLETLMVGSADEPYSIYGLLADDIQVGDDGMSVTFHINDKAKFSDGSPVTPEDVKFSFDTLKSKQAHPGYRIFWADVESATIQPGNHVRFNFSKLNPELYMLISNLTVFPKSWVGDTPFDDLNVEIPIGSGPYVVKSYNFGKQIVYERDPNYWANDLNTRKGTYNFKRIVYKYYKDRTVALEAFKAGEFDFMSVYSSKSWAKDYSGKRFKSGEIVKNTFHHQNNEAIQGFVFNTRKTMFKDKRVREALGLAFDFEWANRMLFYGQYTRSYSFFSNSDLAAKGKPSAEELEILLPYKDQLDPQVFETVWQPPKTTPPSSLRKNLRQAQKLLKEAGWRYKDGALRNTQGEAFEFELMLSSKAFERIAATFARNLRKLGIEMKYRLKDNAVYRRKLETFDFDMTTMRYGQKQSPGNELMSRWHSSSADVEGSQNHPGIKHPVIDALLEKLIRTTDRTKLLNYARAIDRILLNEQYLIPQWFIAYHRVSYWDKFEWPKIIPKYFNAKAWMLETWWFKNQDNPK